MADLNCNGGTYGFGKVCDSMLPMKVYTTLFLFVPGFSFADADAAADLDNWKAGIVAGNIIPVQDVQEIAPEDTEGEILETSLQRKFKNFEGLRGAIYSAMMAMENHKIARTFNRKSWTVAYGDDSGIIILTQNADGTFGGIDLQLLDVKPLGTPAPGQGTFTRIQLQEADNADIDENGYYLEPEWNPKKLFGNVKVLTTVSTVAANVYTVNVFYQNGAKLGAASSPITGLTIDNFKVIDQNGDVITPDTVVETANPGEYTVTCTTATITSGSNQVIPSTTNMYYSEVADLAAA